MQVTTKQGQWLGDIVVREAGSIEAIFEMAVENNMSITDAIVVGQELQTPINIDKRVMNYYQINGIYPATNILNENGIVSDGGIEFWAIEIDLIVS